MSTPCRPLPMAAPRPSQIAALSNRKRRRRRGLPATSFSQIRTPSDEGNRATCLRKSTQGHCIRNPRRKYLRKSPAAAKLSAPPSCSRSIPHPPVLRFPSPTHPISPHFARIVGQHSHLSANNCIETSLISVIAAFMQLFWLQIAITYLLSIWQAFGHVRALRSSFAQPSFKNTFA